MIAKLTNRFFLRLAFPLWLQRLVGRMVSQHFIRDAVENLGGLHAITSLYVIRLPTTPSMKESSRSNVWRLTFPSFRRKVNSSM